MEQALRGSWDNFVNGLAIDWVGLRQYLEREISKLLRQKMQGRPVLVLLLQTPPGQALQPMPQVNGSGNGKPVLDVARQNGRRRRSAATV